MVTEARVNKQTMLCDRGEKRVRSHLGDLGTQRSVLVGVLEEVNHLLELQLGTIDARDVVESDARLGGLLELALGLAEVHGPTAAAAAHAAEAAAAAFLYSAAR